MASLADRLAGKFIVVDGCDGVGKSTQVAMLSQCLRQEGLTVCRVRDPGGTTIGDRIREILLDTAHGEMTVACELMLYMASRSQLVAELIRPALQRGQCVLSDRYISSTVAYQGAGGVDAETVRAAGRIAVGETWPDLTIVLDLPAEEGLARAGNHGDHDRMESKAVAFHEKVLELFLAQVAESPDRFVAVDAAGTPEQVHGRLREVLAGWDFA